MADNIRMDSHKLIYHPDVVARWLAGENIYPIEIEISPSGACNHRCVFCAVDYVGYQPSFLDKETILRDIAQMSKKGLKSVICSGEGEPLLNKDMPDIANGIKKCGGNYYRQTTKWCHWYNKLSMAARLYTVCKSCKVRFSYIHGYGRKETISFSMIFTKEDMVEHALFLLMRRDFKEN